MRTRCTTRLRMGASPGRELTHSKSSRCRKTALGGTWKNIIISPHASALTVEMWEGRRRIFKENLRRFLANEPFLYVCDKTAGF